jgi:hypothetical protein
MIMNGNKRLSLIIVTAMMTLGLLVILAVFASTTRGAPTAATTLQADYLLAGVVELEYGVVGEYNDEDVLTPPSFMAGRAAGEHDAMTDLGEIDLALILEDVSAVDDTVMGYVDLSSTVVFTGVHEVDVSRPMTATSFVSTPLGLQPATWELATKTEMLGSQVNGTLSDTRLELLSERTTYTTTVAGEVETLERQFWISGTVDSTTPGVIITTGEYRETLWGYAADPLTIVGNYSFKITTFSADGAVPTAVGGLGVTANAGTISAALIAALLLVGLMWWFRPKRS